VNIIQPPISRFTDYGRPIIMTERIARYALITRALQKPLPDRRVHDPETDGIRQSDGLAGGLMGKSWMVKGRDEQC
jgi:hypothetical protein